MTKKRKKKDLDLFCHHEDEATKDKEVEWKITISDQVSDSPPHSFIFKASWSLSIDLVFRCLLIGLKLTGYKK